MKDERLSSAKQTKVDADAAASADSGVAQQDAKKGAKSAPKKPRKSFFKSLAGGGGCGGALGVMLLFFWGALVTFNATVNAPAVDDNQVAVGITTFLGGVVCFGPFFVVFCALLGTAVGFIRWRW
ncbi:MAG: hypothetical protein ACI9HK_005215 [Pirellulaceae bacterium]|jgi:hypothetical protein